MNAVDRTVWHQRHVVASDAVDCNPLDQPQTLQWWAKAGLIVGGAASCLMLLALVVGLVYGVWVVLS